MSRVGEREEAHWGSVDRAHIHLMWELLDAFLLPRLGATEGEITDVDVAVQSE